MDKKIAFFDIDGTMVNVPNGMMHPSNETIRVLKEFRKQGNYIVVASARGVIPESIKDIEFDGYICCDGHYIEFNHELLVDNIFTKEQIEMQIDIYRKHHGASIFGGHYGEWYSEKDNSLISKHQLLFAGHDNINDDLVICDNNINRIKPNTVAAIFENKTDMYNAKKELPENWAIVPYDTGHIRMDVHLPGFSKGTACKFIYEHLNINHDNTYAFGDGINDVEMLQLIKHGIAMGNASDYIKSIASEVTGSVDDDGIAKAFKKHFDI